MALARPNQLAASQETSVSFQSLIADLQKFWAAQGCVILQPYDMEMGAGTFHPATALRALAPHPWGPACARPSGRPPDGRFGNTPTGLQNFYQRQATRKRPPGD